MKPGQRTTYLMTLSRMTAVTTHPRRNVVTAIPVIRDIPPAWPALSVPVSQPQLCGVRAAPICGTVFFSFITLL